MPDQVERLHLADEANATFGKLRAAAEREAKAGHKTINLIAVAKEAGMELTSAAVDQLGLQEEWIIHPFMEFSDWFPWRQLWSYYWSIKAPGSAAARAFQPQSIAHLGAHAGQVMYPSMPMP